MSTQNLLEIKGLKVSYQADGKKVCAVNGVDLVLEKGETLGLVGETGAGKTTIAKAILRILPQPQGHMDAGEIFVDGENLLTIPEAKMRKIRGKKISMIFQDPMTSLNPIRSVGDQISEAIQLHEKLSKTEIQQRAIEMLEQVGIPGSRYGDYPHQFSGGMKQRVVIAMALACHPELLLADEPTTALDVTIQAQVLDMMNRLKAEYGTSVVMITHDLGVIAEMCQQVAVIYAGEVVEFGTVEEIFEKPSHPYTKGLFGSLIDLELDVERLSPIPGLMPDPTELPTGCKFAPRCPNCEEACRKGAIEDRKLSETHRVKCLRAEEVK